MDKLILALVFLVFGGVTLADGIRSLGVARTNFEIVGAEHFEIGLAVLLILFGIVLAATELRLKLGNTRVEQAPAATGGSNNDHIFLIGLLIGYVVILPIAGYTLSTALFLLATIYLLGYRNMRWLIAGSVAAALILTLIFPIALDMPFSQGIFSGLANW